MKKDIILFIAIFVVLLLVSGGTYAYWMWQSSSNKTVGFNTASDIEGYIVYDAGESHFVGDFQPSANYCNDSIYNTISFNKQDVTGQLAASEVMLSASIKMEVNSIESAIKSSSSVYWVVINGTSSSCTGDLDDALAYGTFNGVNAGTTLTLAENLFVKSTAESYTIYIWIDSSGSNTSLSGQTLDVNVWTQIDQVAAWYGDVNLDGKLSSSDKLLAQNYMLGNTTLSPQQLKNADVNLDGVIDDTDTALIMDASVGLYPNTLPVNPILE